jgi:tRNA dimethylallyltransferase
MLPEKSKPLVVILGPTAVGKTELAIQIAEHFGGEIVSADSRLFYRGMDIGTAKPSMEELKRVPHHLINVANPDESWSLALFQVRAKEVIEDIHHREKIPFLVGGTGQYIHAVVNAWQPPAQPADQKLRTILDNWGKEIGAGELHKKLAILDPIAAQNIQTQNMRRTVRALEVVLSSGKPFSSQQGRGKCDYDLLQIGLIRPRVELFARIDARIDKMVADGLVDEVRELLRAGYSSELSTMSAIGYREIGSHIRGEMSLDEAIIQMKRLTHQFVRRQANWFKLNDPQIRWFQAGEVSAGGIEKYILSGQGWIRRE